MNLADVSTYDETVLPTLTKPLTINRGRSTKYLGGRHLTKDIILGLSYFARSKEELDALNSFWEVDCVNGTYPFALEIDILGIESKDNLFIVSWDSDFKNTSSAGSVFEGTLTLKVLYKLDEFNDSLAI